MHLTEIIEGEHMTGLRCQTEILVGELVVTLYTDSVVVHVAKLQLSIDPSLVGCLREIFQSFISILWNSFALKLTRTTLQLHQNNKNSAILT
jgi:hypothetical protein